MFKKACLFGLLFSFGLSAQYSPDYKGMTLKMDTTKSNFIRFITWAQVQANYNLDPAANASALGYQVRRARVLAFSQINKDFMILTHFGLNSLTMANADPIGVKERSQMFLHEAIVEYNVMDMLQIGGGLHYQNGISRANNQSTLNMLTLDNNRSSWSTIGLSDQFARHIGIYAKGKLGKLDYRVSVNDALKTTLDAGKKEGVALYNGVSKFGTEKAGKTYMGYFDFQFLDQESNKLPYKVGTYLGGKTIFNLGAGFFSHPSGVVGKDGSEQNVLLWSVDAFYDAPLGADGSAITAYAQFQSNDYGKDYMLGSVYGTGSMIYSHVGYLLPGSKENFRFQPYVSFMNNSFDKDSLSKNEFKAGFNWFIGGHNAKLTAEYAQSDFKGTTTQGVNVQAMIFL